MDSPTHTIDPDGEVIIILRNAKSPFAQLDSDNFPWLSGDARGSHEVTEVSKYLFEQPELSPKEKRKKKKDKKSKSGTIPTALEFASPNEETAAVSGEYPAEETAAVSGEYPAEAAEEAATEEYPAEEPVAEGDFAELPVHRRLRIQVSAKHLMFASPVFKKILTGGWKESITYFQKSSVEVTAESWDIEAFMILLRAIHGQYYHIPRKLTLEMLAKVAVIADYYDCKEALYFLTDTWIKNLEENIPTAISRDLILWLWIA
ncbi:hypothetical protein N7530_009806 [Penicillium desertorum]|uniref:BTB domain-containing protein n=1 Tax=Penicillium desertorum TaxID=1303715 RepID=A0A9W9WJ60_9EURO|nr:hypothetical protein N7530_009806 [Penicillium desertorum]